MSATADTRRPRLLLLGLGALFVAPLAAAWLSLALGPAWQPAETVNHGRLLQPARPLLAAGPGAADDPAAPLLRGRWTLALLSGADCPPECRETLAASRQVWLALNKDQSRVQRLLVTSEALAPALQAGLRQGDATLLTRAGDGLAARLRAALPTGDGARAAGGPRLLLIDPLGNLVLDYTPPVAPRGLLDDLERLLKVSRIG
jgi:hypothetical protein